MDGFFVVSETGCKQLTYRLIMVKNIRMQHITLSYCVQYGIRSCLCFAYYVPLVVHKASQGDTQSINNCKDYSGNAIRQSNMFTRNPFILRNFQEP